MADCRRRFSGRSHNGASTSGGSSDGARCPRSFFNYEFSEDGQADKVLDRITPILLLAGVTALPVTTVLRDYIFPRSATPIAFYIAIGVLGGVVAYFATLKLSRRDLYVVESTTKDEGEL